MKELQRIVFQKKYLLSVIILLLTNLCLFQYFQMDTLESIKDTTTRNVIEKEWKENQKTAKEQIIDKVQMMTEQSKELSEISIFSNKNDFSNKNIWKTKEDFEKIKEVIIDVKYSDHAVLAFLEYDEIVYFLLLFVFITVLCFFDERKSGLWQITYTCKRGRTILVLKRFGILVFLTIVFSGIIFVETLCVAFWDYGGREIIFSSVQSVTMLQNFTLPFSVLQFFFYAWGIYVLALIMFGLFIWGILSVVHNRNLGMIVLVLVYGIEMALYYILPEQHPLCVLRYFNLWFLIKPNQIFVDYNNFPIGTFVVNLRQFVQWGLAGGIVVFSILVFYINKITRPFYVQGIVEYLMKQFNEKCKKVLCYCTGFYFEVYKLLIQEKGILIIGIFLFLIISGISKDEMLFSPAREELNHFYEENTGEITNERMKPYKKIEKELRQAYDAFVNSSDETKEEATDIYQSYEATRLMFEKLGKRLDYAKKLEKKGIDGWWLNEIGYCELLGEKNVSKRMVHGALAILAMILTLAGSFAMERQSGVCYILKCTKKGRKKLFFRKVFCAIVIATFAAVLTVGTEMYEVGKDYSFQGLSAPVQNISLLEKIPFSFTIGQFLGIWFFMRLLIYIMIAMMSLMVSAFIERIEKAQMISLSLLVLTPISGVSEFMILGTYRLKKTVIILVMTLICICFSMVITYRKWRD